MWCTKTWWVEIYHGVLTWWRSVYGAIHYTEKLNLSASINCFFPWNFNLLFTLFWSYRDLRHDNIIAFRGMNILECDILHEKFTLKAGSPFLVMEYIPKNLYRFVEDHRTPESQGLPKSQVWTITKGMANGLMYLHTLNPPISHRDLKPDNILVRIFSYITDSHIEKLLTDSFTQFLSVLLSSSSVDWRLNNHMWIQIYGLQIF